VGSVNGKRERERRVVKTDERESEKKKT